MNSTATIVLIILSAIGAFLLYKWLKPYVIRHDTTITITGGLGTGKTLTAVKLSIVLLRKNRLLKWRIPNAWNGFWNRIKALHNKQVTKRKKGKLWTIKPMRKKPMLYSNIPINFKPRPLKKDREWSVKLDEEHMLLLKQLNEYSIVLIDEMPQFITQFDWNEELVQKNVNEFITYFRHYYDGYFLATAQSTADIVVQIRRKLNQAIFCMDFKKRLLGLFYTVRMCDVVINDEMETISTSFLEDNTKLHFGLFPKKGTYNTRCFKPRINNALKKADNKDKWTETTTTKVLRLVEYISPLDDQTTTNQKLSMDQQALRLARKENKKDEKQKNN